MKITSETNLTSFGFWSGAKDHSFTYDELKELEHHIEELYPDGVADTQVNDLFWFEEEFLCDLLNINYEDDYLNRE